METSEKQTENARRCRECGTVLKDTQETCFFCGESNPLPSMVEQPRRETKPATATPEASPPPRALHDVSTPGTQVQESVPRMQSTGGANQTASRDGDSPAPASRGASQEQHKTCPRCGKDNSRIPNSRFCFACGATLQPIQPTPAATPATVPPRSCPHCGKDISKIPRGGKFCLFCGKTLTTPGIQKVTQQPPPAASETRMTQIQPLPVSSTRRAPEASSQPLVHPPRLSTPPAQEQVDMLNISCMYDAPVLSASFSKDGSTFFVGSARNEIIERVVTNARSRKTLLGDQSGLAITVLIEPGGSGFTTCMRGDVMRFTRVAIRDLGAGQFTSHIRTSQPAILSITANPMASRLLIGGYDRVAEVWDMKTSKLLHALADHAGAIDAVALDTTGKLAATGGRDGAVVVWKVETGDELRKFFAHAKPVLALAFSNDSSHLASGSEDGSIKIWDPERNSPVATLTGHQGGVLALAFDRDGKRLVSGGRDTVARV
ncbi:MAG: hypothetical protein GYA24_19500, partial [Candidatus Lokiarchaeota archaeon]|nr:hypothetical protein [Candidatus Lokiarchaeota archaeon]